MKVGDLVQRKKNSAFPDDKIGIVLSLQSSGYPVHLCVTVLYPSLGKIYDIAASRIEVISEHR